MDVVKPDLPAAIGEICVPNVLYSCVIDTKPLYCFQGLVFAYSLVELAKVAPEAVLVHLIEGVPESTREALADLGVRSVVSAPFDRRHPHSNKLVQLENPFLREADHVVLCDSAVAFIAALDAWAGSARVRRYSSTVGGTLLQEAGRAGFE
jgi:hypothetical protein